MITFKYLSPDIVERDFDDYHHPDARYWSLMKNDQRVGLFGMIDRGEKRAEIFLYVFEEFHHRVLSKSLIRKMLEMPFLLGFTELLTFTTWESWCNLLKRFEREGLHRISVRPPWCDSSENVWFRKKVENVF